uniref:Uncharacterized protein n=1 Tax=Erwinia amylovora ATCC BAA-2158 TaxID=889211 RepID=E5B460_ERWAM|nr:hypothetical protein predicted by Glimmer/Critica [Erwinia amylovora ATCC BAA-2158]
MRKKPFRRPDWSKTIPAFARADFFATQVQMLIKSTK